MNQILCAILSVVQLLFFVGCAKTDDNKISLVSQQTEQKQIISEGKNSSTLVAYFSCTGTTKLLAEYSAEILNADLYEIQAETPYTSEDLNYNNQNSRTTKEQNDSKARPEILNQIENIEQYDNVILAYPIWNGQAPKIIYTFLESYDFSKKNIAVFCTSHSSGIGSSDSNLHDIFPDANWYEGKRFSADTSKADIEKWIDELGFDDKNESNNLNMNNNIKFNFETKSVMLNSGYKMPIVGIGTYSLQDNVCVNSVSEALTRGYRLIDTAYMYHNEKSVGEGIKKSKVPREEVFITTKLYPNQYSDAENAIDEALEKLDVDYIDLMLLHHPGNYDAEAYHAMEKAVEEGKIRSIGLSNWYIEELKAFIPQVNIIPALVQNEIHPYYQEGEVIDYIHSLGIVVEAWYPLGGRGHQTELLNDSVLKKIADKYNKSVAQVILRWDLQKGVVVIPGSSNPEHIQENIEIFDFELTDEEMEQINKLNRDEKHDWY